MCCSSIGIDAGKDFCIALHSCIHKHSAYKYLLVTIAVSALRDSKLLRSLLQLRYGRATGMSSNLAECYMSFEGILMCLLQEMGM